MKIKILLAFLLVAIFSSCQKELVEPTSTTTTGGGTGGTGGGGTGGGTIVNCKDCIYIPTCDSSVYKYSDTSAGLPGVPATGVANNFTYRFLIDTTIGGLSYRKIRSEGSTNGNPVTYFNCTAGVTIAINYAAITAGGSVISQIKTTGLKANAAVGDTWTDQLVQSPTQTVTYTYTMVAKGISRTVSGINYPDVIQVNSVTSVTNPAGGADIVVGTGTSYFARGVGPIENILNSTLGGTSFQSFHRVLISAIIP